MIKTLRLRETDGIDKLGLSTRAYNGLYRSKIDNVGQLLEMSVESIAAIRNLGVQSVDEIVNVMKQIQLIDDGSELESETLNNLFTRSFARSDGKLYADIEVIYMNINIKLKSLLENQGIKYLSDILTANQLELRKMLKYKLKYIDELYKSIGNLILTETYTNTISLISERNLSKQDIAKILSTALPFDTAEVRNDFVDEVISFLNEITDRADFDDPDFSACATRKKTILEISELPICKKYLVLFIRQAIAYTHTNFSYAEALRILPIFFRYKEILDNVLNHLVNEHIIKSYDSNCITIKMPSISDVLENMEEGIEKEIIHSRIHGKTLEEISARFSITRERVRQIQNKQLQKLPSLAEDAYKSVFEEYKFSRDSFIHVFDEPIETFYYLQIKYKSGEEPLDKLITDEDYSIEMRKAAEREIYRNYLIIGSERIKRNRQELCTYVLKTVGEDGLTFEEFLMSYEMLLSDLGLTEDKKLCIHDRTFENRLSANNNVLWKYGKRLRYYNIDSYDFDDLFNELNFAQYHDVECSTLRFFRDNVELMHRYDIQDEYELHNLLKKLDLPEECKHVHIRRMPNIEFGKADRRKQAETLLRQCAPISKEDFAQEYEAIYGVLAQTVLANYQFDFHRYLVDGLYRFDQDQIQKEQAENFERYFTADFYTIEEIKPIFLKFGSKYLNAYNLSMLGYRMYSTYVLRDAFDNALDYFSSILVTPDIIDLAKLNRGLCATSAFQVEVQKLKASLDIVEFSPQKYVNIRKLEQQGITKSVLRAFCEDVFAYISKNEYFTIHALLKTGYSNPLFDLGFDEWFYSALLVEQRDLFSSQWFTTNKLFIASTNKCKTSDFIEQIVYSQDSLYIDIFDLMDLLSRTYALQIPQYKIVESTKETGLFFDPISKKIYADYDTYFSAL